MCVQTKACIFFRNHIKTRSRLVSLFLSDTPRLSASRFFCCLVRACAIKLTKKIKVWRLINRH